MSIGVEEGRITFVTPTAAAPQVSGRRLDGAGRYLMPGLMDVHIHLKGARGGDGRRMVGVDRTKGQAPPPAEVAADAKETEEHTSELQSLMRISYAVFCLKKKKKHK